MKVDFMRSRGYTLVELLVVVSVMALIGVVAFVNFKDFSQDQFLNKAAGQIQSFLRLAQSNATSSNLCGTLGGVSWTVRFNSDKSTADIICDSDLTKPPYKTLALQNVKIDSITATVCTALTLPVMVTYTALSGIPTMADSSGGTNSTCLISSQSITINLINTKNNTLKSFSISKGGAIDVQ